MKKLLIVVGLLALLPAVAFAQTTYYVNYYSNNNGPGATFDQIVRVINAGTLGTPVTSPNTGDICVDIYVFDANQELITCCDQRVSPNGLTSASVANQLTNDPLTSVVPPAGVIKIATTPAPCGTPLTTADASLAVVYATHLQVTGGATYVTETQVHSSPLGPDEALFLPQACAFVRYLGTNNGRGFCNSSVPGN
jgi:hypothetical protein